MTLMIVELLRDVTKSGVVSHVIIMRLSWHYLAFNMNLVLQIQWFFFFVLCSFILKPKPYMGEPLGLKVK